MSTSGAGSHASVTTGVPNATSVRGPAHGTSICAWSPVSTGAVVSTSETVCVPTAAFPLPSTPRHTTAVSSSLSHTSGASSDNATPPALSVTTGSGNASRTSTSSAPNGRVHSTSNGGKAANTGGATSSTSTRTVSALVSTPLLNSTSNT